MITTLSGRLVAGLKEQILAGSLPPGAKLPSEAALIDEYQVSRTVVREAIIRLRAEGLVETIHGRGSFVLAPPPENPFAIETAAVQSPRDVLDVIDFRLGLESETAYLAASRLTLASANAVRSAMEALVSAARSKNTVEADFAFHRAIAVASANRFYVKLMDTLGPMIILVPRSRLADAYSLTNSTHIDRLMHEHDAIAAAILARDAETARAAMRAHLGKLRRRVEALASSPLEQ